MRNPATATNSPGEVHTRKIRKLCTHCIHPALTRDSTQPATHIGNRHAKCAFHSLRSPAGTADERTAIASGIGIQFWGIMAFPIDKLHSFPIDKLHKRQSDSSKF